MSTPQTPSARTRTVVVADDTASVRERFTAAIEARGHKVIAVKSAAELLARVRADLARVDLLLIDLQLPHQTGVDLVRSIRRIDNGELPILVFSGTVERADEVRDLASLGVSGYVNEHCTAGQILPALAVHLGG